MNEMIDILSNFGFPIFAFCLIYIDLRKLVNKNTKAIESLVKKLSNN